MRQIVFLVPPKVHLLDVNGPAHLFYEAKELGASLEIIFSSISNSTIEVESSSGLYFSRLMRLESLNLTENDFVFIPGSATIKKVISEHPQLLQYLNEWNNSKVRLCSICVGSYWLAEAGIIDFKKSTTHWKYLDDFSKTFPKTKVVEDCLFVIEDNLYLSAGVSSGMDLTLHILEDLFGYDMAIKVAKEVVYFFRRGSSDPQISTFLKYRNHLDTRIHDVQDFIVKNINKQFTLDELANEVHMSKRNMSRKFKKTTRMTVGEYLNKVRIERAKHLLAGELKLEEVARECGLKSTNQLRKILKESEIA